MKVRIPNQGPSRGDMLKQVQKMQEDMANLQADLDEREFSATSGGGMISVAVNGELRRGFDTITLHTELTDLLVEKASEKVSLFSKITSVFKSKKTSKK